MIRQYTMISHINNGSMAKENEIVAQINVNLQATQFKSSKFQKGRFNGIAELVDKLDVEQEQTMPVLKDNTGEVIDQQHLFMDDTYPFELYHRTLSTFVEADAPGFGDLVEREESTQMKMVIMYQNNVVHMTKERIKTGISLGMPMQFSHSFLQANSLNEANILLGEYNFNSKEVYSEEFNLAETLLKPQTYMLSLSYVIRTVTNINCINIC